MLKVQIEIHLCMEVKYCFHCTNLLLHLLYWNYPSQTKKCRKYGQYFIYTLNWSMAFTVSIFL